jgi:hypothetical protein
MYLFKILICLSFIINNIYCFNYETNKIIIHKPSFSNNTYFGFTVAGYKIENDSWYTLLF